eukprot:TRINITY_DN13851_c0_g1_i1.p1 TRINITY_DN13851_c0_g1~~TRINITY_DN13851_c0_g1_i1.p1  ORF type:complete len:326 (+),score=29.78 TRINITY_DN13851_c0_g1_i1:59-979(+)
MTPTKGNRRFRFSITPTWTYPRAHGAIVRQLILLKDGTIVSCAADETIKRWSRNGQLLCCFQGHQGDVRSVLQWDDTTLLSCSEDHTVKAWDLIHGECLHTFRMHCRDMQKLMNYRESNVVVFALEDGRLELRRMPSFELIRTFVGHKKQACVRELWDGTLVSCSWDRTVKRWRVQSGECMATFLGHVSWATAVLPLRPEDDMIASGGLDGFVIIWKLSTGARLGTLCHNPGSMVESMILLADGTLVTGSSDRTVRAWNYKTCQTLHKLQLPCAVLSLLDMQDGNILIALSEHSNHWIELRSTTQG